MKINLRFPLGLFALGVYAWLARDWGVVAWEIRLAAVLVRYGIGKILIAVILIGFAVDLGIAFIRAWRGVGEDMRRHGL